MENKSISVEELIEVNNPHYTMDNDGNIIKTNCILTVEPYTKSYFSNYKNIYWKYNKNNDVWYLQDKDHNGCEFRMTFSGKYYRIDECVLLFTLYRKTSICIIGIGINEDLNQK